MKNQIVTYAKSIASRMMGRSVLWDIESKILAQMANSDTVKDDQSFSGLLNDYYNSGKTPNFAIRGDADSASISSVPYFPGTTELLIYNFFGSNYALRDPILFRITLIIENEPISTRQIILGSNEIKWVEDVDTFLNIKNTQTEPGVILVSAHHPRISTRNREFRFFGLCRSSQGLAGCHSMPAGVKSLPKGGVSFRAIANSKDIKEERAFAIALGAGKVTLRTVEDIPNFNFHADDTMSSTKEGHSYYSVPSFIAVTDEDSNCQAF